MIFRKKHKADSAPSTDIRANHKRRCCYRITNFMLKIIMLSVAMYGIMIIALPAGDHIHNISAVRFASAGYGFNLLGFELQNFPDKWLNLVYSVATPWNSSNHTASTEEIDQFIEIAAQLSSAKSNLDQAVAANDSNAIQSEETLVQSLTAQRNEIRDKVEERLEAEISKQVIKLDLHQSGKFIWPPIDFRFEEPPSVIVTSPRHTIRLGEVRLVVPHIPEDEKQRIEREIVENANMSAAVLRTGGLATYPNIIPYNLNLLPMLEVAAHEWLHAYLLFQPLGRAYWQNSDMTSLNETLADIAGDEIGRLTYAEITGEDIQTSIPPPSVAAEQQQQQTENEGDKVDEEMSGADQFDFRQFMYETRIGADELLQQGQIDAAEDYMERRRIELLQEGYYIRKINQAYFAFHGLYAAGVASTSPLANQIWQLRQIAGDAGKLIKMLQTVNSWQDYLSLLDQHNIQH